MPDSYSIHTRRLLEELEQRLDDALTQLLALHLRVIELEQCAGPPKHIPGPPATLEVADPPRRRSRPSLTAAEMRDNP